MKWVSVKDRLPNENQVVLAWYSREDDMVIKARFERGYRRKPFFDSAEFEEYPEVLVPGTHITHWMPLPDPPRFKKGRTNEK